MNAAVNQSPGPGPKTLESTSGRLILRPMAEADEELFCDLYADPETMRFIGPPLTRERAARGLHRILKHMHRDDADQVFFTLIENATGAAIGITSLQQLDVANRRVEAGIIIHERNRSQGFAAEGLTTVMNFAFERLPVDEIWVQIAVDHTVVEKLVISVGLKRGAVTAAHDGKSIMRIWSAHRDSWPARHAR